MKLETLSRIKTAAIVGIALAGVGSITDAFVETPAHDYQAVVRSVQENLPDYRPDKVEAAKQEIVDFQAKADLTSETINVPENVRKAAIYIGDNQTIYDQGNQLYRNRIHAFGLKVVGQVVGGLGAIFASAMMYINHKINEPEPEKAVKNSSPAKA